MREIKFRAYSRKWGMIYSDTPGFSIDVHAKTAWQDCADDENIELMQFTGLLDRNGVEIYEGDIVLTEKLVVKVVEWESLTMQPFGQYFEQFDEWEVIGNIYQNPELVPK